MNFNEYDVGNLLCHEECLIAEPDLCEKVFGSKHEAFLIGLALASFSDPLGREYLYEIGFRVIPPDGLHWEPRHLAPVPSE
jgi:hypothetical protein